jgi:hypothetical protein
VSFGRGQYSPETKAGQHVLAHELAHVAQQRAGVAGPGRRTATRSRRLAGPLSAAWRTTSTSLRGSRPPIRAGQRCRSRR